ncbi:Brain-specific homeobox protein-like protein, partial [Ophiophagus hannah]
MLLRGPWLAGNPQPEPDPTWALRECGGKGQTRFRWSCQSQSPWLARGSRFGTPELGFPSFKTILAGMTPTSPSSPLRPGPSLVPIGMPMPALFQPHPHAELPGKHCRRRKARTVFSDSQLSGLEKRFEIQRYLSTPERVELATALSLSETQVRAENGGGIPSPHTHTHLAKSSFLFTNSFYF